MSTSPPRRARRTPDGYVAGPAAATEATAQALAALDDPRAVILVEGVSDQIAVDTVADAIGLDLAGERIAVVPIGGAQAIAKFLDRFAVQEHRQVAGLCDAGEEVIWQRALHRVLGVDRTPEAIAAAGFHVCRTDLEDELIRAVGADGVIERMGEHGDLGAFRTLQKQPQWVDRPVEAQMRRFIGSGARRKLRYASILSRAAAATGNIPAPLLAVTGCVRHNS